MNPTTRSSRIREAKKRRLKLKPADDSLLTLFIKKCHDLGISPFMSTSDQICFLLHANSKNATNLQSITGPIHTSLHKLYLCHVQDMDPQHFQALGEVLLQTKPPTQEILLNYLDLSDEAFIRIAPALAELPDLIVLEAFGNSLSDQSAPYLASILSKSPSLQRLKLGDNQFTAVGVRQIASAIARSEVPLAQLHLGGNQIGPDGAEALECLRGVSKITSLGLRSNGIGPEGITHIAKLVSHPASGLVDIQLRRNALGDTGLASFAASIAKNSTLRVVELQDNGIGPDGVAALAKGLRGNSNCHAVSLNGNQVGDEGCEHVCRMLEHSPGITTLGLAQNGIGPAGASTLSAFLVSASGLRTQEDAERGKAGSGSTLSLAGLDLGHNAVGDQGAAALAGVFSSLFSLTSVDLSTNSIAVGGAVKLGAALADPRCHVRHLDLSGNELRNAGVAALSDALRVNTTLGRLFLTENRVSDAGGLALAQALQSNQALRHLSYGGQGKRANRIRAEVRRQIDAYVRHNRMTHENKLKDPSYKPPRRPAWRLARHTMTGSSDGLLRSNSMNMNEGGQPVISPAFFDLARAHPQWAQGPGHKTQRYSTPAKMGASSSHFTKGVVTRSTKGGHSHSHSHSHLDSDSQPRHSRHSTGISRPISLGNMQSTACGASSTPPGLKDGAFHSQPNRFPSWGVPQSRVLSTPSRPAWGHPGERGSVQSVSSSHSLFPSWSGHHALLHSHSDPALDMHDSIRGSMGISSRPTSITSVNSTGALSAGLVSLTAVSEPITSPNSPFSSAPPTSEPLTFTAFCETLPEAWKQFGNE
eukprot:gnl/Dysnectes_brevis/2410_a2860_810.p1 GENE.gnl/Dysnectes_brevis/2410_a2860_810~~gnl/Dysnectes_brevis/2410_a2860_810.p1  ORF type:complete len:816 (+),score=200.46 gnl/Dysnectes_brevis/2410_a2860_810:25-2472(+)